MLWIQQRPLQQQQPVQQRRQQQRPLLQQQLQQHPLVSHVNYKEVYYFL